MTMKGVLNRTDIQPRHVRVAKVRELMGEATGADDRVVSNPEPDEHDPKPVRKRGIVSINGVDIDTMFPRSARKSRFFSRR
jgi:hypothetical protein